MRLYAEQGQQALAIRQYQTLRAALETHLDTEPSAAVRRLYADIVTNRLPTSHAATEQGTEPPRAPSTAPSKNERSGPPASSRKAEFWGGSSAEFGGGTKSRPAVEAKVLCNDRNGACQANLSGTIV